MTSVTVTGSNRRASRQYRLPGIQRDAIAQLSILECALWPLQGSPPAIHEFCTEYEYGSHADRKTAHIKVRAPLGLRSFDELVLWGLLAATLSRPDAESVLLASPYWMLKRLGLDTGGSQYAELRESLVRLAVTSYQNDGFYNPESKEREFATFQFLSILLPTVGGAGETVDNDRCWRIEFNPAFFRFCQASGGTLLFDLDLYRRLSPAARRLFLLLSDRFWRMKRVFLNVDNLTVNGLGFSASRPLANRKAALLRCLRELLEHQVIELGRGQSDPRQLFLKRGKGSYVATLFEGPYYRKAPGERATAPKNAIADDPLYEPLRKIGVDGPAIARLLASGSRGRIQKWLRVTEAAMHEKPSGFAGFRVSPAAFLIDGVQQKRPLPDWSFAHEKEQERLQWERDQELRNTIQEQGLTAYEQARAVALREYQNSPEGRTKLEAYYTTLLVLYKVTVPDDAPQAARQAARQRLEAIDFKFPDYDEWSVSKLCAQL